jgi:hypothetical protein
MCTKEETRAVIQEEMKPMLDEAIESLEYRLREDVLMYVSKSIKEIHSHIESAPKTVEELEKLHSWQKKHDEEQTKRDVLRAIRDEKDALWKEDMSNFSRDMRRIFFGDKDLNEIGMVAEHKIVFSNVIVFGYLKKFLQFLVLVGTSIGVFIAFRK